MEIWRALLSNLSYTDECLSAHFSLIIVSLVQARGVLWHFCGGQSARDLSASHALRKAFNAVDRIARTHYSSCMQCGAVGGWLFGGQLLQKSARIPSLYRTLLSELIHAQVANSRCCLPVLAGTGRYRPVLAGTRRYSPVLAGTY